MMNKPALTKSLVFENVTYNLGDICSVIDSFYKSVSEDELLSIPFSSVKNWPDHIENLSHFWWIKFGGPRYSDASYNPPLKHFQAGFNQEFLNRWLELFKVSLDENLNEEQSKIWQEMSVRMGDFLLQMNNRMNANID